MLDANVTTTVLEALKLPKGTTRPDAARPDGKVPPVSQTHWSRLTRRWQHYHDDDDDDDDPPPAPAAVAPRPHVPGGLLAAA
jgi:hypothetical protein